MRIGLNEVKSITWIALLSLTAVATAAPAASAMSIGAHAQSVRVGALMVHRVDSKGDPINGRRLFLENNCYICHGGRGGGGMCPSLRSDKPDQGDVTKAVLQGTPSGMPSFARLLTNPDVADLAAYIDSLRTGNEPTFTHWWEPLPR